MHSGSVIDGTRLALPDARQAEVDRALELVAGGHGGLVWTAEYGMGRSTLLDAIVEQLTAEMAGLGVPEIARVAAEARAGDHPDFGNAAQLRRIIGQRTLVVIIDDAHECPPHLLEEVVRLLRDDSLKVVLLATALSSPFGSRAPHDIDVRELPPLSTEAALRVFADAGCHPVAPHVAARLVNRLSGNPSCLIQTARALTREQLAGTSLLPDPLPVVPAMRIALKPVTDALDAAGERILLVASVAVTDRIDTLTAAAGTTVEALASASLASQLTLISGQFAFADQRLRAIIHGDAALAERTDAHLALASAHRDVGDQDVATWHTALATLEGDGRAVPSLLALAHRHLQRGDTEWAHAVAREAVGHAQGDERLRACELSGVAALLSGHVHDAAHWLPHAARSGDLALRARTLFAHVTTLTLTEGRIPDDLVERTRAEGSRLDPGNPGELRILTDIARGMTIAACLHFERGSPDSAHRLISQAHALLVRDGVEVPLAVVSEGTGLSRGWLAMYAGDLTGEVQPAQHARLVDDEALDAVARGVTLMQREASASAASVLASAVAEVAPLRHSGRWFSGMEHAVSPLVEAHLRVVQALVEMRAGDIARASVTIRAAAEKLPVELVLAGLGVTLSRRLDVVCDGRVGAMSTALANTAPCATAAPVRLGMLVDRALTASFREEHVQAATLLELAAGREVRESGVVMAVPGLDAVETWAMAGRPLEARRALQSLRATTGIISSATRTAELARAEVSLASRDEVEARAAEATAAARSVESAYERGKVELSIGRAMARLGMREPALAHLMAAQDLFEQSGASAWVSLVQAEGVRVSRSPEGADNGVATPHGSSVEARLAVASADPLIRQPALDRADASSTHSGEGQSEGESWAADLTEREVEVARLVAQGMSNRDVAAELFCSVRTVEVHLGRVYRKLELRSRFDLVVLAHRSGNQS